MFTAIQHWLKFQLLLHVPLWVCGSALVGLIFLPEAWHNKALLLLFFTYFLLRYGWRKHLKKQDKLRKASSGVFSLVFWGIVAAILLYSWANHKPDLAIYARGAEPNTENDMPIRKHSGKRSLLQSIFKNATAMALACQYAKQEKWLHDCTAQQNIELDNNPETVEIILLEGEPTTCEKADCRVWLVQMPREQDPKAERRMINGKRLANWDKVMLPIQIGAENGSGWRSLHITHTNGEERRSDFSPTFPPTHRQQSHPNN